jgi:hypothetical protein
MRGAFVVISPLSNLQLWNSTALQTTQNRRALLYPLDHSQVIKSGEYELLARG